MKTKFLAAVGLVATCVTFLGGDQIALLIGAGVVVAVVHSGGQTFFGCLAASLGLSAPLPRITAASATGAALGMAFSLGSLVVFFVKVGAVLFGSGYVLLAFLRAGSATTFRWVYRSP